MCSCEFKIVLFVKVVRMCHVCTHVLFQLQQFERTTHVRVSASEVGGPQHGSQPSLTECERPPTELILI